MRSEKERFAKVPYSDLEKIMDLKLSKSELKVYLMLKAYQNHDKSKPWPIGSTPMYVKTLAHLTKLSERTVNRSTAKLESFGLIRVHYTTRANHYHRFDCACKWCDRKQEKILKERKDHFSKTGELPPPILPED